MLRLLVLCCVSEIRSHGILAVQNPLSSRAYIQSGPASVMKVPLSEYHPLTPIEGF
jgi:hypothetical protein